MALIQPGRYHVVCQAKLRGGEKAHEYNQLVRHGDVQKAVCGACGADAEFQPAPPPHRFDHAYEDGAYATCRRCGEAKEDHDR